MKKILFGCVFFIGCVSLQAAENSDVNVSTVPLGSSFYRHLAGDFNLDIKELVKFERKGFGRTEVIIIAMLAKETGKTMKELGNRRLKDKLSLKALTVEAGLDYETVYDQARKIKLDIESRGDNNLPPPVFESPTPSLTPKKKDNKKESQNDK